MSLDKSKHASLSLTYYQQHKEERLLYQKQYNKGDKYKEYQKEYFQQHKTKLEQQRKARREAKKQYVYKKPAQYKLDAIERVLRKKLKEIQLSFAFTHITFKPITENETVEKQSTHKYYTKKLLKEYQYSLPQAQPFADFVRTPTGFALTWD